MGKQTNQCKKSIVLLLIVSMMVSLLITVTAETIDTERPFGTVAFTMDQTGYTIDGVSQTSDIAPYIQDNRIMVPVRFAAEALGATVDWNESTRTVIVSKGLDVIIIQIESSDLMKNGHFFMEMDTTALIVDPGRAMIPISPLAQALKIPYQWDPVNRTAYFMPQSSDLPDTIVIDTPGTYGPEDRNENKDIDEEGLLEEGLLEIIDGSVIITSDGVTLQNRIITGNLIIAEEVGDGSVFLNNIAVKGETFIRGGGKDSIYVNGGAYNKITIERTDSGAVRIVAIDVNGLEILISEAAEEQSVILNGNFDTVIIEGDNVHVILQGKSSVEEMIIKEGITGTIISMEKDTVIDRLNTDEILRVQGEGTIIAASGKEASNATYEKMPENMTERITAPPAIRDDNDGQRSRKRKPPQNDPGMKVSPETVSVNSNFDQIFTLTIENNTVSQAVYREHVMLTGVFDELNLGNVIRENQSTVTAEVYGNLEISGLGTITLDQDSLVDPTEAFSVDVTVEKGVLERITIIWSDLLIGPDVGETLFIIEMVPEAATLEYQWQYRVKDHDEWIDITDATDEQYLIADPVKTGDWVRVVATGVGHYTGTVESEPLEIGRVEFSCPFIYSFDGEKHHFEHEAIPFAVNRALETTSYGTLRQLQAVEGKYHVKIAEELQEISYVNGFRLMAVDYPANEGIQEVVADIFGNPHTIKDRVSPVAFVDSNGKSRLAEITKKGQMVTSEENVAEMGRYVDTYNGIFIKPEDAGKQGKLLISTQKTEGVNELGSYIIDRVDGLNHMWWIERVLETPAIQEKLWDFVSIVNLRIELWNGEQWIKQGEIKAGMHLLEEFLVPLDLSLIAGSTNEVKVRLVSGAGLYEIDQISIDYSDNVMVQMMELKPNTALFNGEKNVQTIIGDFDNDNYVRMIYGDRIELTYKVPALEQNHERGFIVALKGYYYINPNTVESTLIKEWESTDHLEIINEVLTVVPDAVNALPGLMWLMDLIESTYQAPLEEKLEAFYLNQG